MGYGYSFANFGYARMTSFMERNSSTGLFRSEPTPYIINDGSTNANSSRSIAWGTKRVEVEHVPTLHDGSRGPDGNAGCASTSTSGCDAWAGREWRAVAPIE